MADDTDDSGGVILEGPFDPDAQATVTDFIDYTEYLPSDLLRSLTLIRHLDETYLGAAQKVHDLTKIYGQAPDLPPDQRPNLRDLRKQISAQLDRAVTAREAAYAESCRLYDVVDRHYDRLESIKRKLEALPKPPAPEQTPPAASSHKKRSKVSKKSEDGPTRITLRVDGRAPAVSIGSRSRSRRSLLASQHLTDFDPDSPLASTEHSDNEAYAKRDTGGSSEPATSGKRGRRKELSAKRMKLLRQPGMGTNAHSAVAGISTSNALALLKPPPEDAKMGSEDLPWLRLTEWEMTKLRKKMKKNAVWQPSEIMIHRELAKSGRGWEGYRTAKIQAEAAGENVLDCDDIENNYIPGKLTRKTDATVDNIAPTEEPKLSNRGMKLNEAKKLKRETLAREQAALAAAEAELAAKRLGDIGSTFKSLFSLNNVSEILSSGISTRATAPIVQDKHPSKRSRKRKYEESATIDALTLTPNFPAPKPGSKKTRVSQSSPASAPTEAILSTSPGTSIPPIDISHTGGTSPPTRARSKATSIPPSTNLITPINTKTSATPTPPATRPPSRRRSVAASMEPTTGFMTAGRDHSRRKSATPASRTPAPEVVRGSSAAASSNNRRKKRPAPGIVSSGQDGGAAVSYGRRKAKPAKKRAAGGKDGVAAIDDYRIDEDGVLEEIDPNEPRYCLCGDVSFGTMICCENPDVSAETYFYRYIWLLHLRALTNQRFTLHQCDKEWFHLDCVGLSDVPSRTAKWYCPDCRVKFNKGSDGIVKVGSRR